MPACPARRGHSLSPGVSRRPALAAQVQWRIIRSTRSARSTSSRPPALWACSGSCTSRRRRSTDGRGSFPSTNAGRRGRLRCTAAASLRVYARSYFECYGLPVVCVRPFNNYGPRSHFEGDSGEVIPRFLLRALAGQPPVIFGDGAHTCAAVQSISVCVRHLRPMRGTITSPPDRARPAVPDLVRERWGREGRVLRRPDAEGRHCHGDPGSANEAEIGDEITFVAVVRDSRSAFENRILVTVKPEAQPRGGRAVVASATAAAAVARNQCPPQANASRTPVPALSAARPPATSIAPAACPAVAGAPFRIGTGKLAGEPEYP